MDSTLKFDLGDPLTWLFGSVALAVLTTNLAWLLKGQRRHRPGHPALQSAPETQILPALGWLLQALYALVPPVLAWRLGVLSPYLLGIAEPRWIEALSTGASLAVVIVGTLLFGWLVYRHTETLAGPAPATGARLLATLRAPLDALLQQWHWAFYRALLIGWLASGSMAVREASVEDPLTFIGAGASALVAALAAQPLYWGAWSGMAWAALEFGLNPFARARLRRPGEREAVLRLVALAIATTALFTLTRNFWLCLACHLAVETIIAGWLPLRRAPIQL